MFLRLNKNGNCLPVANMSTPLCEIHRTVCAVKAWLKTIRNITLLKYQGLMLVDCPHYYASDLHREGHYKMTGDVCLPVCRMPRLNFRTDRPRKPTIAGWKPIAQVTREAI